jgi:hypothetical protein
MTMLKRWMIASCAAAMVVVAGAGDSDKPEDTDYDQRLADIENLDLGAKEQLSEKQRRFEDLSDEEKEKLRKLHRALQAQPNREELEQVMEAYYKWVRGLDSPVRARLNNETSPEERVKQVIRYKAMPHQHGPRFGGPGGFPWPSMGRRSQEKMKVYRLAFEQYDVFKSWATRFVIDHSRELASRLPSDVRQRWKESLQEAQSAETDKEAGLWRALARWYLEAGPKEELPLTENDIADFKSLLTGDSALPAFANVPPDSQVQMIGDLLRGFVREQLSWDIRDLKGVVTRDELEEYARRNPEAKRDLHSDTDFARYQIRRRYVESRLGAGRPWSDGRPRGSGFRDGSRRDGPPGPGQGPMGGSRPSFGDPRRGPNMHDGQKTPVPDRHGGPR